MHELEVIEMEDFGLTTPCRHPEDEFAEIIIIEEEICGEAPSLDKIISIRIQLVEKSLRTLEIVVEEDFSVKKRQILEIFKGKGEISVTVDTVHISTDLTIVGLKVCPDPGIETVP